jgi:hypothetical protein
MNEIELYTTDDFNGNPIYYIDEDCTKPYTGHLEEYDRGFICREGNIVNGYYDGVCKEYYDYSDKLEMISHMKYSLQTGLSIEFYESGKVRAVALVIQNYDIDYICYDENGEITEKKFRPDGPAFPFVDESHLEEIKELREKYNLMKIHEEIVRDGEKFNYKKYFGL